MKALNIITLVLVIVGALNWGLVGAFNFDLVAAIFGVDSSASNLVYILVGLAGIYQLIPLAQSFRVNEARAQGTTRS